MRRSCALTVAVLAALTVMIPASAGTTLRLVPLAPWAAQLKMVSARSGWAFGRVIARTVDGAATFTDVTPPGYLTSGAAGRSEHIVTFALNAEDAWVLLLGSTRAHLLRTRNGGVTWNWLAGPPVTGGPAISSLTFVDPDHGWLTEELPIDGRQAQRITLLRTVDGGRTWVAVQRVLQGLHVEPDVQRGDCTFLDDVLWSSPQSGVAGVSCPYPRPPSLEVTSDGGRNWHRLPLPAQLPAGGTPLFGGASPITAAGRNLVAEVSRCSGAAGECDTISTVDRSRNGGRTWSVGKFYVGPGQPLAAGGKHLWVVNGRLPHGAPGPSLLISADAGHTWRPAPLPLDMAPTLHSSTAFQFLSPRLGYAVTQRGFTREPLFYRTVDGGRTFVTFTPRLRR